MEKTRQALLWHQTRGEYVVVGLGSRFGAFVVTTVNRDQVILTHKPTRQHFILPRTSDTSELKGLHRQKGKKPSSSGQLVDPYRPAPGRLPQAQRQGKDQVILDPYADSQPSKTGRDKPVDPYATSPAAGSSPQGRTATNPGVTSGPLPPPVVQSRASKRVVRVERRTVSRRKFNAVALDFGALSKDVQVSLTARGARIDRLTAGSYVHGLGLRAGDVVVRVDKRPIRSLDDAAAIYARLLDAERFVVELQRGTDTIKLNYRFTR